MRFSAYHETENKVTEFKGAGIASGLDKHPPDGVDSTAQNCMIIKVSNGNAIDWVKRLGLNAWDGTECRGGGVASDTRVWTVGKNKIFVLDAADGSVKNEYQVTNTQDLTGVVRIGDTFYISAISLRNTLYTSVQTVNVSFSNTGTNKRYGVVLKFTISGDTLTAVAGAWIGTTTQRQTYLYDITPAYNITGKPHALIAAIEMQADKVEISTGYSAFIGGPGPVTDSNQYRVSALKFEFLFHC